MKTHCQMRMVFCFFLLSSIAMSQMRSSLETTDTRLRFEGGADAPKLTEMRNGSVTWKNSKSETLICSVERDGVSVPLVRRFNSDESRVDKSIVSQVYETTTPRLRLTREWEVRSPHGPIEHQMRIENRDAIELWLPLQDSFVFDWQVPAESKLEQFDHSADSKIVKGAKLMKSGFVAASPPEQF